MCSRKDIDRISSFLSDNLGVVRGLADWQQDINNIVRCRMTRRELAQTFRQLPLEVCREQSPARYEFRANE